MTYALLALPFLAVAGIVGVLLVRGARPDRVRHWASVGLAGVVLVVLTAVFDSIMIAAGLFHYAEEHLFGVLVGLAPLEDFAYPIAGAVLLPAVWWALTRRAGRASAPSTREDLTADASGKERG